MGPPGGKTPQLRRWALSVLVLLVWAAPCGAETYTYDAVGRLTGVTYGDGTFLHYTYDPMGNRLSVVSGLDTDGDGVGDATDAFPTDPAASVDTDGDGHPDAWNPGKTGADSTTGLTLDAFPADSAASVDTDGDGYPDAWNPGKTGADSTTGLVLDAFPNDPLRAVPPPLPGVYPLLLE